MVAAEDVRAWINSTVYASLLDTVVENLNLSVNSDPVPDTVLQLDANKLNLAKLEPSALIAVAQDADLACRYIAEKLNAFSEVPDEQEGKSPDDEDDVIIETHAFYQNFLNLYLIELHFLRFNSSDLEDYLKSIRIPGAKKYSAQLKGMYKSISG
ncbi:hypothetical protein ACIPZC_12710 [Pseudomonas sp. NPDC089743]|uniref:hypothetical protein n=1 Tax=Pseudomonas sp. NPDC089743 TaxID=3364471 RepID=UPI0038205221